MIYLEVAGWRHRGSSPLQSLNSLLRDVTLWHGLGLLQDERPADRRALEGAVAKAGSISFERFQRVKRESKERGRASSFELSGFGHRPQAAGPIRVSV